VEFLRSFRYRIIPSANKDNSTSFFPIWMPFISFYYLIALNRNSITIWNKNGESEHLCLVPDFKGNDFSLSHFSLMLGIGLSYPTFIMLRYIPSSPVSSELLSWEDIQFYQRLSCMYWNNHMGLSCFCLCVLLLLLTYVCWTIPARKLTWS
jgi:hypothetical protein